MSSKTMKITIPRKSCSGCFFYGHGPYGMFPECKLYKKRPSRDPRTAHFLVKKPRFCKTTIAFINYGC